MYEHYKNHSNNLSRILFPRGDMNKHLLIPDEAPRTDQSYDSIQVYLDEPVDPLGLRTKAWMRSYLQECGWLPDSVIIEKP